MGGLKDAAGLETHNFNRTAETPRWATDESFGALHVSEQQSGGKKGNPVLPMIFSKINALKDAGQHAKQRWIDLGNKHYAQGSTSPNFHDRFNSQLEYIDSLLGEFYKLHLHYKATLERVPHSSSFNGNISNHKRTRSGSSQSIFDAQKVADLEEENQKLRDKIAALEVAQKKAAAAVPHGTGSGGSYLGTGATPPELESIAFPRARLSLASFTKALASLVRESKQAVNDSISILNILSPGSASVYNRMKFERPHHRKYVLESYISQIMFSGLENEAYTIDKNPSSVDVMDGDKFQTKSFQEYKVLKPLKSTKAEELRNEHDDFFKYCYAKFREVFPEELERKLFSSTADHGDEFIRGHHPTTPFYEKHFSPLALSVWLVRLLMFSFSPVATIFRVETGATFNETYMKSVVDHSDDESEPSDGESDRMSEGGHLKELEVGVMVMPGFRVGKSIVKSIVYLVPRN